VEVSRPQAEHKRAKSVEKSVEKCVENTNQSQVDIFYDSVEKINISTVLIYPMYLAQKVNCAAPSAGHCDKYITAKPKPACVSRLELNKTIVNRS
jgi:hypothetical protein